jgi:uncharacterized protein YidB (DUF937 family)
MGLLDQLAGQMLGGQSQGSMVQLVMALINNTEGGLPGLLSKLQAGGLGEQVSSWLGGGANEAVGAGDISAALGSDVIGQLAGQFGLSGDQVAGGLAEALPGLVDKLSPEGQVSGDNALVEQGLSMLGGLFGGR